MASWEGAQDVYGMCPISVVYFKFCFAWCCFFFFCQALLPCRKHYCVLVLCKSFFIMPIEWEMYIQKMVQKLLGFVYRQDCYILLPFFRASYSSIDPLSVLSDGNRCQHYYFIKISVNRQTPVILFFILVCLTPVLNVDGVKPWQLIKLITRMWDNPIHGYAGLKVN